MQYRHVEAGIGKWQALCVALHWREVHLFSARQSPVQHGAIQIEADIPMVHWQIRQVEPRADAGQQHATRCRGQRGQAVLTRRLRGARNRRVVERRDQRVAVLQTQCSTRGMASVNSGISASKCVPSSATIW